MNYYENFNDYEILYLIKEKNPKALEFMFFKYENIIDKLLFEFKIVELEKNDYAQELRMVLDDCIKTYTDDKNISFYSYFMLCAKRKIFYLLDLSYKSVKCENKLNEENAIKYNREILDTSSYNQFVSYMLTNELDDDLDKMIFEYVFLKQYSVLKLTQEKNLEYYTTYRRYKAILKKAKSILTIFIK